MKNYQSAPELNNSLLGKTTTYTDQYDASLLHPIPRKLNRDEINLVESALPFRGEDIWTGYELSWLNRKGKPQVAVAEFKFPCTSPNIVESKSFKLYLNSFNQTRFDSAEQVKQIMIDDLSAASGAPISIDLYGPEEFNCIPNCALPGTLLDDLDIEVEEYNLDPAILEAASNDVVSETLHSHLLKSNCLITSQPDWASLVIEYRGQAIEHASLLKYIIAFRNHNEFHEQCVERIFSDLFYAFQLEQLTVYARYTRRGGLDINPYRSTESDRCTYSVKINRQ